MKEVLKFIGFSIIIISPVIFIFHFFVSLFTYEYIAQINDENKEKMIDYLEINNIEAKNELKEVQLHAVDWDEEEFILVYKNDETEKYIFTMNDNSQSLAKYIIECSGKNDRLGLRTAIIVISIIASIVTLCRLNRTEIVYEGK